MHLAHPEEITGKQKEKKTTKHSQIPETLWCKHLSFQNWIIGSQYKNDRYKAKGIRKLQHFESNQFLNSSFEIEGTTSVY